MPGIVGTVRPVDISMDLPPPHQPSPKSSQVGWKGWIWQDTPHHLDKGPGHHQGLLRAEGQTD